MKTCVKYEEKYSLGHLSYVFVSQAHPQVIVFMQQNLLLARVSDATGLIPEGQKDTHPDWKTQRQILPPAALTYTLIKIETKPSHFSVSFI